MSDGADPRWLDAERTAAYISVRVDALPRLVRQRRIPEPDYLLGPRSPRWDRLALDAAFDGGTASTNPRMASHAGVQKILAQGRSRRSVSAERRKLAGEALPTPSWSSDSYVPVIDRIILDVCELPNNPLPGMGQDDVWLSLDDLRAIRAAR